MSAWPTDRFRGEVLALHAFLSDWLTGRAERGDGCPTRLAAALVDDFVVVHPDGSRGDRSAVLAAFAAAHGSKPADYALAIGRIDIRPIAADLCLATYEEIHRGEPGRARVSTAVLRRSGGRREIQWLFLQETPAPWLE